MRPTHAARPIAELLAKLGLTFRNPELLVEAITHRSYLNEHRDEGLAHNERLEFLGDAIMHDVVTQHLVATLSFTEGELTRIRAALENNQALAEIAEQLELWDYLLVSRGEASNNERARAHLAANAVEAIIAAIFLDRGAEVARLFIETYILSRLPKVLENDGTEDAKSYLQERIQADYRQTPAYRVLWQEGPDHNRQYTAGVYIGDVLVGKGNAANIKLAEQAAAQSALQRLDAGELMVPLPEEPESVDYQLSETWDFLSRSARFCALDEGKRRIIVNQLASLALPIQIAYRPERG